MHTNEIMVLLGDNWFAERSAKQAAEIVQRRTKGKNETIAMLEHCNIDDCQCKNLLQLLFLYN